MAHVTLDKELVPVKFWKSPGSEVRIRIPDPYPHSGYGLQIRTRSPWRRSAFSERSCLFVYLLLLLQAGAARLQSSDHLSCLLELQRTSSRSLSLRSSPLHRLCRRLSMNAESVWKSVEIQKWACTNVAQHHVRIRKPRTEALQHLIAL